MKKNVKWLDSKDIYTMAEEGLLSDYDKKNNFLLKNTNYIESIDLMEKGFSQIKIKYDLLSQKENIDKDRINIILKNIKNIKNFLFTFIHNN